MARRALDGSPKINTRHGQSGFGYFGKHLGYDYGVPTGTPVKAPVSGKIRSVSSGGAGGNIIEMEGGGLYHRFLHLQTFHVKTGQQVNEGQIIATSNNTGTTSGSHLHHDTRKPSAWNASFNNYVDWEKIIAAAPLPPSGGLDMPAVGARIQLIPTITRTTFRAGTTNVAGTIRATDNTFIYTVRGYDPNYKGRILINSASAGGDGVALALYYVSGNKIDGWRKI